MKKLITIFSLAILALGCEKEKLTPGPTNCIDPSLIDPQAMCTAIYDPVCGCDGETYPNACEAEKRGGVTSYTQGQCGCTYKYQGTVVDYTGLDACSLMIELSNGTVLEPVNLPKGYQLTAGASVELDYRVITTHASICMAGELADIVCIRNVSCLPIVQGGFNRNNIVMDDQVTINKAEIKGDCLEINFSYGGGCGEHEFQLERMPMFCATPPVPPITLQFLHDNKGDLCQAYLTKTLSYDLTSLQDSNQRVVEFYLTDYHGKYNEQFIYHYSQ